MAWVSGSRCPQISELKQGRTETELKMEGRPPCRPDEVFLRCASIALEMRREAKRHAAFVGRTLRAPAGSPGRTRKVGLEW